MKGGYQIIDLRNKVFDLNGNKSYVYDGVYDLIENTRKVIYFSNVVVIEDNQDTLLTQHSFYANVYVDGSSFKAKIKSKDSTLVITIEDTDVITIEKEVQ